MRRSPERRRKLSVYVSGTYLSVVRLRGYEKRCALGEIVILGPFAFIAEDHSEMDDYTYWPELRPAVIRYFRKRGKRVVFNDGLLFHYAYRIHRLSIAVRERFRVFIGR